MMTRKERQEYYAQLAQREADRKARQAAFKADPAGKAAAMERGKEQDARVAQKHQENGTRPLGPVRRLDSKVPAKYPNSAVGNLIRAGVDKANPRDVYGHNARERAQLPTKPVTPGKYEAASQKRQKSARGLTTFGPEFRVKGGNRKKVKKVREVSRPGFVQEVPDRLKKYLSA
ncbi:hypothetical protein ACFRJ3_35050 [Streptomyces sp. NPDC056696]|uniref:hypothetical protein n=1 Tax=Streptomyces sp. NPDC056696 TaxID=3345914 RepID=UPI0036CAFCFC